MYVREGEKKTEPVSFQQCPVTEPEAMGTHWNIGGPVWTSGNTFSLWGWPSTATGCPERWWSLHPWRYAKAIWTCSWAAGSTWPCLSKGVWPDALQRTLPASTLLSVIVLYLTKFWKIVLFPKYWQLKTTDLFVITEWNEWNDTTLTNVL